MEILIVIILFGIAGVAMTINIESEDKNTFIRFITICVTWGLGLILGCIIMTNKTPSALDVYRGKTELRITSVNGVPTDTIVVYKYK